MSAWVHFQPRAAWSRAKAQGRHLQSESCRATEVAGICEGKAKQRRELRSFKTLPLNSQALHTRGMLCRTHQGHSIDSAIVLFSMRTMKKFLCFKQKAKCNEVVTSTTPGVGSLWVSIGLVDYRIYSASPMRKLLLQILKASLGQHDWETKKMWSENV